MKKDIRNLKKRYLIWLYKTTKEELDKIDRKFTQLEIDKIMLNDFKQAFKRYPAQMRDELDAKLDKFRDYIQDKEMQANKLKFNSADVKELNADYIFLRVKLDSIKSTIKRLFGNKVLAAIQQMYEQQMTQRILRSDSHL
jgi:hypothetical protein